MYSFINMREYEHANSKEIGHYGERNYVTNLYAVPSRGGLPG